MKKTIILLAYIFISNLIVSCDNNDDKFTGSPVGVIPFETITGVVSSNTTFALPGQTIDFTATLPVGFRETVNDTVTVEATTFTIGGSVRRGSVDILPGQNSATGEIKVGGGEGTFEMNFDLKLTAINLKKVVPGKHYLINSNTITIASGSSIVPTENDRRLKISVDWQNTTTINKLRVKMERVKLSTVTFSQGSEGYANVKIGTTNYLASFATDLATTASNFVTSYRTAILAANANMIDVIAVGSDLQFSYNNSTFPVMTVTTRTGLTAPVTAAVALNNLITFTANNSFDLGNTVKVHYVNDSDFEVVNAKIISVTPTSFTVLKLNTPDGSTSLPATATVLTGTHIKGTAFTEVKVGQALDIPKNYFLSNSKLGTTSEGANYGYTPGIYKLKIGVDNPSDLAVSPVDLKYRITLRYPDGRVEIFNGVYTGLTATSGYKDVLLITKNGLGDTVNYTDVTFTP
jgi:hypothetical protein